MKLIEIDNGTAILAAKTATKLADFMRSVNLINKMIDEMREQIQKEMEEAGIIKIETDDFTISYTASHDREKFKTKDFRKDYPNLYDDYVEISNVKASIKIKLKED